MKKPGNKKLLKSNRISGFQKADHQKLPIDKTRRIISQKFHFFKIFKVGLIGALIFGILFELALEHVPGLLLWSIYGIIVKVKSFAPRQIQRRSFAALAITLSRKIF